MLKIKNLFTNATFFFLGAFIFTGIGVGAACLTSFAASNVSYSGNNSNKEDVQQAIDELYYMSKNNCPKGYECRERNLRDELINNSLGIADNSVDNKFFDDTAENKNEQFGIYVLKDTLYDDYPVYFYRGDNTVKNNVIFSGYCWKIVRTTEKGGVRLLYNGVAIDHKCEASGEDVLISVYENKTIYNDNYQYSLFQDNEYDEPTTYGDWVYKYNVNGDNVKYVGYMYKKAGTNDTNSNIKNVLDTWYKGKINTELQHLIEDSIYCNDRSIVTEKYNQVTNNADPNEIIYFGGSLRVELNTPSTKCVNVEDRFTVSSSNGNGDLKYPVGFLTVDEEILAGKSNDNSMDTYLTSGRSKNYWLGTPAYYYVEDGRSYVYHNQGANAITDGDDDEVTNANMMGVRPVISLKVDTTYVTGDGSSTSPYIIKID